MPQNFNKNNKISLSKFESMLKTNSVFFFDATEFEGIIHYYLDIGRPSLADKAIKLGLEQHPSSISLKLLLAEFHIFNNNFEKARVILDDISAIEPNNEEVYIQRASMFSQKDDHIKAIECLKKALIFATEEADILALLGMEYLYLDNFDSARLNFAKCLEVDFDDYSSLYNVIYCFEMQNQHEEAITYLNKFIDKDPYSEVAWHQLGRQHFVLKQYSDALRAFDYAVIIDEFFVGAILEKAKTFEKLNREEEAIESYLITNELEDPTAFAYYRIGECYNKLDQKDLAVQYYKKTVKEDPLLDKGWLALTKLYYYEKNYQKSLYYINKALSIDDSNTFYWRMYSEICLKLNLFEEAASGFYNCIDHGDDNLDIYLGLSDVLNFIGEFDDSMLVMSTAIETYPQHAEIEYRIACLCFVLGKNSEGKKFLLKALKTDYGYHKVMKELFPAIFDLNAVTTIVSEFKS
jgi:tetratricopeptide (TPR) repeat protein